MSPKTLYRKYFAKRYVSYKGQHKITLTDIRIMPQFCLVQHVNLFPYSLARDSFGEPIHVSCYLRIERELFRFDINALTSRTVLSKYLKSQPDTVKCVIETS